MGEKVDRRGFLRLGRRHDEAEAAEAEDEGVEREPTPKELKIRELADFAERFLASYATEGEERVAEGPLLTKAYDQAYMLVTDAHIVYTTVLGVSAAIKTGDVVEFRTEPPAEAAGHGVQIVALLRAHHPADPPHITRSYAYRFPDESPLIPAIRTVCGIPEPQPEGADEQATAEAEASRHAEGQEA